MTMIVIPGLTRNLLPQDQNRSVILRNADIDYLVLVNKENKLPEDWESVVELEDAQNTIPDDVELNENNDYLPTDVFKVEKKALAAFRALSSPMSAVDERRMLLDQTAERLARAESRGIADARAALAAAAGKLSALDPMATLSRGYSAVFKADGMLVRSLADMEIGDRISVRTVGGEAVCTVDEVKEEIS